MKCPACHAELPENARFCGRCRAPVGSSGGRPPVSDSGPKPTVPQLEQSAPKIVKVGSGEGCHVVVDDDHVSRLHAEIWKASTLGRFVIRDHNSTNGTYVSGRRIQETEVDIGDVVQLGTRPVPVCRLVQPFFRAHGGHKKLIGRGPPAHLIVPFPVVSTEHARIWADSGQLYVQDAGSTNGTFVNGRTAALPTLLPSGATLMLGTYRVPSSTLETWSMELSTSTEERQRLPDVRVLIPKDGTIMLGRAPDCDVVVDDPLVSWHHATIQSSGGEWSFKDVGSSNGTFLNGQRSSFGRLNAHDELCLGPVRINLDAAAVSPPRKYQGQVRLDALNLTRQLEEGPSKGRVILDGVSLSIYPGELVALMGPSGAGKTTLLELLTGQRRPSRGRVLFNGHDLWENIAAVRSRMGYVPQEDVMHRDLTVFEVLYYAALQRLPSDVPEAGVRDHVERLLTKMGLAHIRDSCIGGEQVRGISGGQRKRVNIALELITEPPLLFLDEPTSGLDAKSALEVAQVLRDLASSGKTIVVTIHQPRREVFEFFDQLILLSKGGKLAYYGPCGERAMKYFEPRGQIAAKRDVNPADYVIDVLDPGAAHLQRTPEEWEADYKASDLYAAYVQQRQEDIEADPDKPPKPQPTGRKARLTQTANLTKRYLTRKLRDKGALWIQLAQAPIVAVLLGVVFGGLDPDGARPRIIEDQGATLFLLAASCLWLGCSNVAREIVADRAVYQRERLSGLSSLAYYLSIFTPQFLLAVLQAAMLLLVTWPWLQFGADSLPAAMLILPTVAALGITLGMLVSARSRTEVGAISIIPLLVLPQLMLAGFMKPYGLMKDSFIEHTLAVFTPLKWAFLSVMDPLLANAAWDPVAEIANQMMTQAQTTYGCDDVSLFVNETVLLLFIFIFVVATLSRLRSTSASPGR